MNDILLSLKDIHLRYHGLSFLSKKGPWVLKGVSFDLLKGEWLGVVGANGSGKSTLLKVCSGTLAPCRGSISLGEHCEWPQLLSLNAGFEPHLNAKENLIMMGLLYGAPRNSLEEMIPQIIAEAGLEEVSSQPLGTYSPGMRARLGFSMALAIQSKFLCLDEILSVGDASFRHSTGNRLRERMEKGASGILVTHQPKTLTPLCKRTLWLNDGEVKMLGETDEVVSAYLEWANAKARERLAVSG